MNRTMLALGLAFAVLCSGTRAQADSGLSSLVQLTAMCRPWVAVAFHGHGSARIPERVWVMADYDRASTKAAALRSRGKAVLVEPAFGVRVFTAIVIHESGGHPWIIGDNGSPHRAYTFATKAEAVGKVNELFSIGHRNLDLGLAQLNTGNLPGLALSVDEAFSPCTNVRAGGMILARGYYGAAEQVGYGASALSMSLSAYNTGKYYAGASYAHSIWAIGQSLPSWVGDLRKVSMR